MAKGWIRLHRKIRDNWIWDDPEKLRAWLDILLMVNHEDKEIPFNGKIITIRRGQRLTSISQLAERWHWNRKRVVRYLDLLEGAGMCTTERTTSGTTINVVNWDFYQSEGSTVGTTNGTTEGSTVGSTVGTQTRMNKNDKEAKNARARAKRDVAWEEFVEEMKKRGEWVEDAGE